MYITYLTLLSFSALIVAAEPIPPNPLSACAPNAPSQVVGDPSFDLPTPTVPPGFNEGPWIVHPTQAALGVVGPGPQYDISGTTSHSGPGDL